MNPMKQPGRQCFGLRLIQNGRHFDDGMLKWILLKGNCRNLVQILMKMFFPVAPVNNMTALVNLMAWHCTGDKRLSEPIRGSPANWCIIYPLVLIIFDRNTMFMQPTAYINMSNYDDFYWWYRKGIRLWAAPESNYCIVFISLTITIFP